MSWTPSAEPSSCSPIDECDESRTLYQPSVLPALRTPHRTSEVGHLWGSSSDRLRHHSAMTPERGEFERLIWSNVEASSEEVGVATARFVQTGITPDEYDQMREKLGVGDTPPAGGVFHAAAVGEDGKIRVFEVWDSREQAEAWGEKVMAVRTEAGFGDGPPSIEYLDVHKVVQR